MGSKQTKSATVCLACEFWANAQKFKCELGTGSCIMVFATNISLKPRLESFQLVLLQPSEVVGHTLSCQRTRQSSCGNCALALSIQKWSSLFVRHGGRVFGLRPRVPTSVWQTCE